MRRKWLLDLIFLCNLLLAAIQIDQSCRDQGFTHIDDAVIEAIAMAQNAALTYKQNSYRVKVLLLALIGDVDWYDTAAGKLFVWAINA